MKSGLLIYRFEDLPEYQKIKDIVQQLHLDIQYIQDNQIDCPLQSIIEGQSGQECLPLNEPMIIFVNMDGGAIDNFLATMRQSQVPFIPLKAMVTPTNLQWTFGYLHQHVKEEYITMMQQRG